jgi:secreted trypsin-like serine protease
MLERILLISTLFFACRAADPATDEDAIIGGRIDRSHHAVGQVGRLYEGSAGFHCSGTLIGPRTVLTAAHCLFMDGERLYAGDLVFDVGGVTHAIARSSVSPSYDPTRLEGWEDAALLRLDQPSRIDPIAVSIDPPLDGVEAEVLGFGVTGNGGGAGRRRRARITIGHVSDREIFYDSSDAGACYGDSGGPILQNDALVGVTSRGTASDCREVDIAQRADVITVWIGTISRGDACIGWCEED